MRCNAPYCTVECQTFDWKRGHKTRCNPAPPSVDGGSVAPASAAPAAPANPHPLPAAARVLVQNCLSSPYANSDAPVPEDVAAERAALLGELQALAGGAPSEALLGAQGVLLRAVLDSWRNACTDVMDNREGIKADVAYGCCDDFYDIRWKKQYNVAQRRPELEALEAALACCGVAQEELHELLGVRDGHEVPRPLYPLPWDGVLELGDDERSCRDGGLPDPRGGPPRRGWITNGSGTEARKYLGGGGYTVAVSYTNQRGGGEEYN